MSSSWTEYRLTPESFDSYYDGLSSYVQFLGDYSGSAVSGKRVFPCYASTQNGDSDIFVNPIVFPGDGDFDGDGDVDLDDFSFFDDCMLGPDATPDPAPPTTTLDCLDAFDFDIDGHRTCDRGFVASNRLQQSGRILLKQLNEFSVQSVDLKLVDPDHKGSQHIHLLTEQLERRDLSLCSHVIEGPPHLLDRLAHAELLEAT